MVPNPDGVLRLLQEDQRIELVILDDLPHSPGHNLLATANALRTARPALTLVGQGAAEQRGEFEAAGVGHFLKKPWTIAELIALMPP